MMFCKNIVENNQQFSRAEKRKTKSNSPLVVENSPRAFPFSSNSLQFS